MKPARTEKCPNDGAPLTRVEYPAYAGIAFLFVALYHGLNGLRNIILDYSVVGPRVARVTTAIIVVIGIIWAYWGVTAFVGNPEIAKGLADVAH